MAEMNRMHNFQRLSQIAHHLFEIDFERGDFLAVLHDEVSAVIVNNKIKSEQIHQLRANS